MKKMVKINSRYLRPGNKCVGLSKVVPVHALKVYRRSRGIAPFILHLDIRYRRMVNFTYRPLYPREAGCVPYSVLTS